MEYAMKVTLKPRQLEAIKHNTQAPQLILAGAGIGKTTTITAKIAYIVEKENIDIEKDIIGLGYPSLIRKFHSIILSRGYRLPSPSF
jgi:DNA helicase IV